MTKSLKAGVIGAGVFGGHHARKYASFAGVDLIGVHDPDDERATILAADLGARAVPGEALDALFAEADLITLASPALTHASLAVRALELGAHIYVEKPLATTVQEAEAILGSARDHGRIVACGHQERIVFEAMGLFSTAEKPVRIEAVREGPWTGRSTDISVVLDLMIHDLDLALRLAGAPPATASATGRALQGVLLDEAEAEIRFEDGLVAVFRASRAAPERRRAMRVVYEGGDLDIDFIGRTFTDSTGCGFAPDFAATPRGRDPLAASVADFVEAVRGDRDRPTVTGAEAADALALALAVELAAA